MIQRKEEKNAKTGGDDQCQKRKRWPSTRVSEPLNAAVAAAVVVVEGGGDGAGRGGAGVHCLVLSSFSSSMSFLEALTLLETSFP